MAKKSAAKPEATPETSEPEVSAAPEADDTITAQDLHDFLQEVMDTHDKTPLVMVGQTRLAEKARRLQEFTRVAIGR